MQRKDPLYRRVNTRARGVRHRHGGEYRWARHNNDDAPSGSMHGGKQRGLDYTPLFKFLLSRIGHSWDEVHGDALARLDRPEPMFWMVARTAGEKKPFVLLGENSYYSGLFVDAGNRLAVVDPELRVELMKPRCACCTHTFNGVPFIRKFEPE